MKDPEYTEIEMDMEVSPIGEHPTLIYSNPDWYQHQALRTTAEENYIESVPPDILHGAIGLATEAGEILDNVKRALFYGAPLDRENLIEELGDIEWYLALIRNKLNVSQKQVQEANISKLRTRYPESFSRENALHRDLDKEKQALETKSK